MYTHNAGFESNKAELNRATNLIGLDKLCEYLCNVNNAFLPPSLFNHYSKSVIISICYVLDWLKK